MARRIWPAIPLAALAASAVGVGAAPASATELCPTFAKAGVRYQWETLGAGLSCTAANAWVARLSGEPVRGQGKVALSDGPRGYRCFATLERRGRAVGGICYKGTVAAPSPGFTWFGS